MNYEDRYKEALNRAKQKIDAGFLAEYDLSYIFPELAESEDERMCTRCIELLRKVSAYSGEEYIGVEIVDCIIGLQALRKKLKEQKPADRFEEAREKYQVEWSEEDENVVIYLHELIGWGYVKKVIDAQIAHDMRKWVNEHLHSDTFQNGKSRWKPSEEQIHAIVEALKYLPNNKDEWRILDTLVDVFRKLM